MSTEEDKVIDILTGDYTKVVDAMKDTENKLYLEHARNIVLGDGANEYEIPTRILKEYLKEVKKQKAGPIFGLPPTCLMTGEVVNIFECPLELGPMWPHV